MAYVSRGGVGERAGHLVWGLAVCWYLLVVSVTAGFDFRSRLAVSVQPSYCGVTAEVRSREEYSLAQEKVRQEPRHEREHGSAYAISATGSNTINTINTISRVQPSAAKCSQVQLSAAECS